MTTEKVLFNNDTSQTLYAPMFDEGYPYALVLRPGSTEPERHEYFCDTFEMHSDMYKRLNAVQVPYYELKKEIWKRQGN